MDQEMSDASTVNSVWSQRLPAFPPSTQDGQLPTEVNELLRLCDLYYGKIHDENGFSIYGSDRDEQRDKMDIVTELYSIADPVTAVGKLGISAVETVMKTCKAAGNGAPSYTTQGAESCRRTLAQSLHKLFLGNVYSEAEYDVMKECEGFSWSDPYSIAILEEALLNTEDRLEANLHAYDHRPLDGTHFWTYSITSASLRPIKRSGRGSVLKRRTQTTEGSKPRRDQIRRSTNKASTRAQNTYQSRLGSMVMSRCGSLFMVKDGYVPYE